MSIKTTSASVLRTPLILLLLVAIAAPALAQQLPQAVPDDSQLWAVAELSKGEARVEENLLLRLRVFSRGNLATLEVNTPTVANATVEKLDGPRAYSAQINQRPYVVNEFRYAVTPLSSGEITVPVISLTATKGDGWPQPRRPQQRSYSNYSYGPYGYQYSYRSQRRIEPEPLPIDKGPIDLVTQPILLKVDAPADDPANWLPIYDYRVELEWEEFKQTPRIGEPHTLTIIQWGLGAKGEQLPPLAERLASDDIKLYAEPPETGTQLHSDGLTLLGYRRERVTIVPQVSGRVEIPTIQVSWWSLAHGKSQTTTASPEPLVVAGDRSVIESNLVESESTLDSEILWFFWLPLSIAVLAAFAVGWWIGNDYPNVGSFLRAKGLQPPDVCPKLPAPPSEVSSEKGWRARLRGQLSALLVRYMPRKMKLWWCLSCLKREEDLEVMMGLLLRYVGDLFKLPPLSPLQAVLDHAAARCDDGMAGELKEFCYALEGAIYAKREIELREFKRRISRLLPRLDRACARNERRVARADLPGLNPN